VANSRVARSDIHALRKLGARVRVVGPATMLPTHPQALGVEAFTRLEEGIEGADVVIALRIQKERLKAPTFPSDREYARYFGLNSRTIERAAPDCLVMHPGPINRGVEISSELADGPRSAVLDQVEHGVAVRMAVVFLLAGGGTA
jgi:aspartate carbamoyltransferase catalytic subunit